MVSGDNIRLKELSTISIMEWIRSFTGLVREVARELEVPINMVYVGRSHNQEQFLVEYGLHESNEEEAAKQEAVLAHLKEEEHFISTLQFSWPQVSCLSGFPTRGSLVVLASYVDSSNENQKFALRFSRISDVEDFITSLEDILLNKVSNEQHPPVDVISAISCHSEIVPAYRPDTSSVRTPKNDPTMPKNLHNEDQQDTVTQDTVADSQSNVEAFPPRFSSLVSGCSTETEQGKLALALADGPQDLDLKTQISKYMQDASFLDIVNKVNEVITELGGDFVM